MLSATVSGAALASVYRTSQRLTVVNLHLHLRLAAALLFFCNDGILASSASTGFARPAAERHFFFLFASKIVLQRHSFLTFQSTLCID